MHENLDKAESLNLERRKYVEVLWQCLWLCIWMSLWKIFSSLEIGCDANKIDLHCSSKMSEELDLYNGRKQKNTEEKDFVDQTILWIHSSCNGIY
jgi:hypothetical protein